MSEKHPIEVNPNLPLEKRVQLLENYLAQVYDQVWWLSLPEEKFKEYQAQGFKAPIEKFYLDE